eukprot:753731-Hanusia_phi.AAC.4
MGGKGGRHLSRMACRWLNRVMPCASRQLLSSSAAIAPSSSNLLPKFLSPPSSLVSSQTILRSFNAFNKSSTLPRGPVVPAATRASSQLPLAAAASSLQYRYDQPQIRSICTSSPCLARQQMTGVVVTNGAQKSVVVAVERTFVHPKIGKMMKTRKKYMAHDEEDKYQVGDRVIIEEHRPITGILKLKQVLGHAPTKPPSFLTEEDKQEIDAKFAGERVQSEPEEQTKQVADN